MPYIRRKRSDDNQAQIVKALRKFGCQVIDIHTLGNCCDLVVIWRGLVFLVEIKRDKKAKLTPAEKKFIDSCSARVIIATSFKEVINGMQANIIDICRKNPLY
jgi:Holliday junction resolvase